jgi:spermidine/putrescine transport system permease protein/putrescine transport system permease protein
MSAQGWAERLPLVRRRTGRRGRRAFDRPRFLLAFFLVFVFFTFAPLAVVALFSFNSTPSLQNFSGFSLQWYDEFFSSVSLR